VVICHGSKFRISEADAAVTNGENGWIIVHSFATNKWIFFIYTKEHDFSKVMSSLDMFGGTWKKKSTLSWKYW
jgi:hypothetical protein